MNVIRKEVCSSSGKNIVILVLEGRITMGEGTGKFRTALNQEICSKCNRCNDLVLDMSSVVYMDSSGILELVSGFEKMNKAGGKMKLLSPSKKVSDLLKITHLLSVFEVFSQESDAVESFG